MHQLLLPHLSILIGDGLEIKVRLFVLQQLDRYTRRHSVLSLDRDGFSVRWLEAIDAELLLDLVLKEVHLATLAVHQHNILGLTVRYQLHDALGVGVSAKRHVLNCQLDLQHLLVFELDLFLAREDLVADSARHTVAWYDDHVLLEWSPLLEYLE